MDLSKLAEMLLEFFTCQFKIEATDEYLTLWIGELHAILGIICSTHSVFLDNLDIGIWLLYLLTIIGHHEVIVAVMTTMLSALVVTSSASHMPTFTSSLMIVG